MIDLATLRGKYKVVYLDPAWPYYGDPDKDQAAGKHYNEMRFEELQALPVRDLFDGAGVAFMWVTGPKLEMGIDLLRTWGLHYRGIAYIWVKTTKDGKVIEGQGVRPSFVKSLAEVVLVGTTEPLEMVIIGSTGARGRTLPLETESQGQWIFAPRGAHSEKPPEARWRIEELFGDVPRLEMFARCQFPGWDTWGREADGPMPASEARSPKLRDMLIRMAELEEQKAITAAMGDLPQE